MTENAFISFSANAEDVILNRLFATRDRGFYVDVGAAHPTFENDTRALYDRGWSGINVEPNPAFFPELVRARPRDQNFQLALSDEEGTLTYWEVAGTGLSTCDSDEAARARDKGHALQETQVRCTTLAALLGEVHGPAIDLLKVDVEGFELRVLQGNDWTRFRPSVVVVEATYPETSARRPDRVRPFLEQNGYDFCYFDGLNDFFVERGFAVPEGAFLPPNVFDHVVPHTVAALREHAANLERAKAEEDVYVESLRINKAALEAERASQATELARLSESNAEKEVYVASLKTHLEALEAERDGQRAAIADLEHRMEEQTRLASAQAARAEASEAANAVHTAEMEALRSSLASATANTTRLTGEVARLGHQALSFAARATRDRAEAVQALRAAELHGEEVLALRRRLAQAVMTEARLHRCVAEHVATLAARDVAHQENQTADAKRIESLRIDLAALHRSTSWRLTGPMRRIARLIKR